ncbi:MAG: LysM peptidoglycan-binding domain-containing protein [Anaerolineae bacterium]|nr:LysM peptidoglycan-binding domain-containing protein [Anaerolineae bacterium]
MQCSRCGAEVRPGMKVCPVCGARLREKPRTVRCRYCGYRFSAELTLCPNCGRERRPAQRSWMTWSGGLAIIALIAIGLVGIPFARSTLAGWIPRKTDINALMETALPTVEFAIEGSTPMPTQTAELALAPTPVPTVRSTRSVDTPTSTPTATLTPNPTATPTATLTSTPVITLTASSGNTYTVVPGDTLSAIARRFGVTIDALERANGITDATQLQIGQQLIIPSTEETPAPSTQPENAVYLVAPGDTLFIIARRFGVTVEELARVNGIEDTSRLQVNQRLLIPRPGGVLPTTTPTPRPKPTPTPTPTVALIYPAPKLLSPADGTPFSGGEKAFIELRWKSVGTLQPGEVYVVHLGFLVARDQINWFYEDTVQGTGWRVPGAFQSLAPQVMGRSFRWYVQVEQIRRGADGRIVARAPRSPRSPVWGFTWN